MLKMNTTTGLTPLRIGASAGLSHATNIPLDVFDVSVQNRSRLMIKTNKVYDVGQKCTVSEDVFRDRLSKVLSPFGGFWWKGVFLAGGIVSGLLEKNFSEELYKHSDLDLFVWGNSQKELVENYKRAYMFFHNKFKQMWSFTYKNSYVTTILTQEYNRPIQLIGVLRKPMEIITSFDLTHCQIGFDGLRVFSTEGFRKAIQTRISKITTNSIQLYRIYKTYLRGYSIEQHSNLYIKNTFHTYGTDNHGMPTNTDIYWNPKNIQTHIDDGDIKENDIVQKNMEKSYIPSPCLGVCKPEYYEIYKGNITKYWAGNASNITFITEKNIDDLFRGLSSKHFLNVFK
jgi:hypothetical protein